MIEKRKIPEQKIEALRNKWETQKSQIQNNPNEFDSETFGFVKMAGQTALKLCIEERTGKKIYIPYALQPFIIIDPEIGLIIKTHSFSVIIKGRGLDKLSEHLANDTLLWIKETRERVDDANKPVFIQSVEYEGLLP